MKSALKALATRRSAARHYANRANRLTSRLNRILCHTVACALLFSCAPGHAQTGKNQTASSLNANAFSGTDIFDQANQAVASLAGAPGVVTISPGVYSNVTTTLVCSSDVEFRLAGVSVSYSGTGSAISCQAVSGAKIAGPLHLTGTGIAGTVGLYVGSPAVGQGLTCENKFEDITVGDTPALGASHGFEIGVKVDGNVNSGTYYNKFDRISANGNLSFGWVMQPSELQRANSNRCVACTAFGNGVDGFLIDGVTTWTFVGPDSEANGRYNFNLPGTMPTTQITVLGGDFEGAGVADFNFGGGINVSKNFFIGMNVGSPSSFDGSPYQGMANAWWPGNAPAQFALLNGSILDLPVGWNTNPRIPPLWVRDTENSNHDLLRISRISPGQGEIAIGTSQYPVTIGGTTTFNGSAIIDADLTVNGTINKSADHFRIDHPLDPAHKYLLHSVVESPDMKNIYDGVVTLDGSGEAEVTLPVWFEALNRDFRYQLTCIGASAPVFISQEVQHNAFRIAGGRPGMKVSWQVTGNRHDSYALKHPVIVEQRKPFQKRGGGKAHPKALEGR